MQADEAKAAKVRVGDTVSVFFAETGEQRMKVVAVYGTRDPLGAYTVSTQAFDANVTTHVDNYVVVSSAPGVSATDVRHAINGVLADSPTATLRTRDEFKGSIAGHIDKILNLVYVLLAMALLIALFGIANTLALSVFERTREFGLLRAVGMSRAQVRATVRWESVLVALLGTTLGTGLGLGISSAVISVTSGDGVSKLAIPVTELVWIIGLAAVVCAVLPARRAARLDVLDAISTSS